MDSVYVGMWVYGLSLRLRSPENGPQVSLHAEGSSIDRLVTEGAILVPHLLLAGPAQKVARETLGDLCGHLLEANGTLRLHNGNVVVLGSINFSFDRFAGGFKFRLESSDSFFNIRISFLNFGLHRVILPLQVILQFILQSIGTVLHLRL